MKIGLMGAAIDSDNMGCLALTYSLLNILNEIENEEDLVFDYYFFDGTKNISIYDRISSQLSIKREKLHNAHMGLWIPEKPLIFCRCIRSNLLLIKDLLFCDCIIDVTGGDSFTDIYGMDRFLQRTHVKNMCGFFRKPLLFAPQTYGPFNSLKTKTMAKKALQTADVVLTRDEISKDVVKEISGVMAIVTTDMAFQLPYHRICPEKAYGKIRIGINFSGLLAKEHIEQTDINFSLRTNYDIFMDELMKYLVSFDQYDIFLIPHVTDDAVIHRKYKEKYPQINFIEKFSNPIEAKDFISSMDIFVGARMHGTIAAFTTGVACIPTAYSRKFKGVFNSVGYNYIVDLQDLQTEEALKKTISYIQNYKTLEKMVQRCNAALLKHENVTKNKIKKWIIKIKS